MKPRLSAEDYPAQPGTYILVLDAAEPLAVPVGRLGLCTLPTGRYAYVGSAHGSGGLRGRLAHHLGRTGKAHWHIDALTSVLPVADIIAIAASRHLECAWLRRLLALNGTAVPIRGFGNSDCRAGCPAHLVLLPNGADLKQWGR